MNSGNVTNVLIAAAAAVGILVGGCAQAGDEKSEMADRKEQPMTEQELRARLTPEQYHVTQEDGTEPPFKNEYWDNHRAGIYVDVVSGEPLFKAKARVCLPAGCDPVALKLELEKIAAESKHLVDDPAPRVRFRALGESSLDFQLMGWIDEPVLRGRARQPTTNAGSSTSMWIGTEGSMTLEPA